MIRKIIYIIVVAVIFVSACIVGKSVKGKHEFKLNEKKVAFRLEMTEDEVNYGLGSILDYLVCDYERKGFEVLEPSYLGDLYPQRLNDAKTNIFVRGNSISLDKRYIDEAHNIYFVDRFTEGYFEELNNFDEYISTNKNLCSGAKSKGVEVSYLEVDNCGKRPDFSKVKNKDKIIYIYEGNSSGMGYRLLKNIGAEIYSSVNFYKMGRKNREKVFRQAKVVIYDCLKDIDLYGGSYLFAANDIKSYGLNLITSAGCGDVWDNQEAHVFFSYEDLLYELKKFK